MGRPEPCVLFGQTFAHSQLDEYVDEVIFAEPVVITACEFLEQNASSISSAIPLLGATSPPSFALEVFVQCEGETRFRRLCQPFLYSHSSSNVLEVEAVVTSHLVVRGSYRSLSLVVYGNTAEDLGQFNIEFDLDSSLSNLVSSAETKLEELPPVLRLKKLTIEESITSPNALSLPVAVLDISVETKKLLKLIFKVLEMSDLGDSIQKVLSSVVAAAASCVSCDMQCKPILSKPFMQLKTNDHLDLSKHVISDSIKQLLDLYKVLHDESRNVSTGELVNSLVESEVDIVSSKELVDMFCQHICFTRDASGFEHSHLNESKNVMLGLSTAFLLCSGRETCFHFVNGGGMERLACILSEDSKNSAAAKLMILGVVEQATRYSVGCEGYLGWWPREDDNVLNDISKGYSQLLQLLLQEQSHDVASLATYILRRLRFYEVISKYERALLSVLGGISSDVGISEGVLNVLTTVKVQLKKLLNLINTSGAIEDPSPVARACKSLMLGHSEGLLSYKATSSLIASSSCCFSNFDIDFYLLALLKERGFFPLSIALLASTVLRAEVGPAMDVFVDIVSSLGAIILSLLFCRSGLLFLLQQPELSTTLILALRGSNNTNEEECVPPRYASILISRGFFCDPQDVGKIVETHLRVVNAIDRLLMSTPHSEEFLWILWELCGLSRFESGRQALFSLEHFPEALSVLIQALHSAKESEQAAANTGTSHVSLAIFHSAAEIFEVLVTDSTASSLSSWIEHAVELHTVLHSSSHGSNRKDAPARLLEWIDASVIYHKHGALGLLRYAAVLASGDDAHLTSTSMLVSDSIDVDNVAGESSGSDTQGIENLGKIISDKSFDGIILRDSSVAQLTTAFRILAFISENSLVAACLYDEGATAVIFAVLVNCRSMLERSSNSYDYLVDEGTECNSTSELLLERNREQSLIDLLIPCLVLLISVLQRLQEANEQHRNTKLLNALLHLHREVSPRLAACAADLDSPYPDSALRLGAVCHLTVSALACWPIYNWTPGLFNTLLAGGHAKSLLALGPKEICSFLCLLNDLFPEEGISLWKNGMPLMSSLRALAVGSLLGTHKERQVNWYLQLQHVEVLLSQLEPQIDKIAQIIQDYTVTSLVVIHDMLRVFIIRVASLKAESASLLLRPLISSIRSHLSESSPSETDVYKVFRLLSFLASLLEHPQARPLLLREGGIEMLIEVLERCTALTGFDGKQFTESRSLAKYGSSLLNWSLPVFKSISLICTCRPSVYLWKSDKHNFGSLNTKDCSSMLTHLLRLCQVLPVGKELADCLTAFKDLGSCHDGRSSLLSVFLHSDCSRAGELEIKRSEKEGNSMFSEYELRRNPPLLSCWTKLLSFIDSTECSSGYAVDCIDAMSSGALQFCLDGKSLHTNRVAAVKKLFGLCDETDGKDDFSKENLKCIRDMANLLSSKANNAYYSVTTKKTSLYQVLECVKSLLLVLHGPAGTIDKDGVSFSECPSSSNHLVFSKLLLKTGEKVEKISDCSFLEGFGDKYSWECPEILPDRLSHASLPAKRKVSSLDGLTKRARGDNTSTELVTQSAISRGVGLPSVPVGPTRRDTFRQRKPNTSRPPSMHVDDYVARERNVDGGTNSNVIAIQRVGRPPSIHVDEFMARQRERQNPIVAAAGDIAVQSKNAPENKSDVEKISKPKQLKPELDDELQGIDIVFDGAESESDDKLPFPQPDDNLQQAPVIADQSSPHFYVEETQSDSHGSSQFSRMGTPPASITDENAQSKFPSRTSISRPERTLSRESSISCDMKFYELSDDSRGVNPAKADSSAVSSGFPTSTAVSSMTVHLPKDSRIPSSNSVYTKSSLQAGGHVVSVTGSLGLHDRKYLPNQPPFPPLPPSVNIAPVISQPPDPVPNQSSPFLNSIGDAQQPMPTTFNAQSEYMSAISGASAIIASSLPISDSKHANASNSSPTISTRPPPPPPTPPPYSSMQFSSSSSMTPNLQPYYNQPSVGTSELSQSFIVPPNDARVANPTASAARVAAFTPPPLVSSVPYNRPTQIDVSMYAGNPTQQQSENFSSVLHNLPINQPLQHVQPLPRLQPLQPPQIIRPPQPPNHPRPPNQVSPQIEQGLSMLQTAVQLQPLQILQQPQVSPVPVFYQSQQPENFINSQQQQPVEIALHQQGNNASQPDDSGMSLQDYFSSPQAIQTLLSDRDKLCQLLEQHPKLMQMLQERLGQL